MEDASTNALRFFRLLGQLRDKRSSPAFRQLSELGLSFSHMRAMQLLQSDRCLAMKDLAEQLELTPPSVTALVRRLVLTGLVHRGSHVEDNRVVVLSLTDQGRSLLRQLSDDHVRRLHTLLKGLSVEEQQVFLDLLERAVGGLGDEGAGATCDPRGS
ncbi:MAG: MarR family transcriptional regulator [Herpetosiphon sp.]